MQNQTIEQVAAGVNYQNAAMQTLQPYFTYVCELMVEPEHKLVEG